VPRAARVGALRLAGRGLRRAPRGGAPRRVRGARPPAGDRAWGPMMMMMMMIIIIIIIIIIITIIIITIIIIWRAR
jgi:hypothetical protein